MSETISVEIVTDSAPQDQTCKNCKCVTHPAYLARYDGYCLDCDNAGVPEKDAVIGELLELFKQQSIRSFVCGAGWWEFRTTGFTMWASDRDLAWSRAAKRFPFVNVDHRENDDVLTRYQEIERRHKALDAEAPHSPS